MMHFNKMDNPEPILIKTIFGNTVTSAIFENLEFVSWRHCKAENAEIAYQTLQASPSILYTLAQQIFLENNKGLLDRKKSYQLSLFLSPKEFTEKQNLLYALFRSPCAFIVTHPIHGELFQVNTNDATVFGKEIFEKIHTNGVLPTELDRLFYKKSVISDMKETGMYEITAEKTDFRSACASPFFQDFCKDDTIRSLDVSALSLKDCAAAPFFKYLLQQKKRLYFYTEAYRFANKRISKHLFWEGLPTIE